MKNKQLKAIEGCTPGLFKLIGTMQAGFTIHGQLPCGSDTDAIATVATQHNTCGNATLLAAAPKLLEERSTLYAALQRLLDCPDLNLDELEPETREAIQQAEDAISIADL